MTKSSPSPRSEHAQEITQLHNILRAAFPEAALLSDEHFFIGAEIGSRLIDPLLQVVAATRAIGRLPSDDAEAEPEVVELCDADRDAILLTALAYMLGNISITLTNAADGFLSADDHQRLSHIEAFFTLQSKLLAKDAQLFADSRKDQPASSASAGAGASAGGTLH